MGRFTVAVVGILFSLNTLAASLSSFESKPAGEDALTQALISNIKKTLKGRRDAHPKAHGCVDEVEVTVLESDFNVGLFKTPGKKYQAILRSSSGSSRANAADQEPGGTGFALKILLDPADQKLIPAIEGEEFFLEEKYYKSFDIITINALDEFMVNTVADYPEFFAAVGAVGPAVEQAKKDGKTPQEIGKVAQETLNKIYFHLGPQYANDPKLVKRPLEAALMGKLNSTVIFAPLSEKYQSWVPSLLGEDKAVKYQFRPCDKNADPQSKKIAEDLGVLNDTNYMRAVLKKQLQDGDICYTLGVQVHKKGDPSVEDAAHAWAAPTDGSERYVPVATVRIPQKQVGQELFDEATCEALSFNPAHAPDVHRPIGGIQRARRLIYAAIETERNKQINEEKLP